MKAVIIVTLKPGVLDPQGQAIEHALHAMGIDGVDQVRQGKYFEVDLESDDPDEAMKQANKTAERLLANLVVEDFRVELVQ